MIGIGIWLNFLIFFTLLWTNLDLNTYLFKIGIVLSFMSILVYANSTFRWESTCYKEC